MTFDDREHAHLLAQGYYYARQDAQNESDMPYVLRSGMCKDWQDYVQTEAAKLEHVSLLHGEIANIWRTWYQDWTTRWGQE
jgi:hypothetical protein